MVLRPIRQPSRLRWINRRRPLQPFFLCLGMQGKQIALLGALPDIFITRCGHTDPPCHERFERLCGQTDPREYPTLNPQTAGIPEYLVLSDEG